MCTQTQTQTHHRVHAVLVLVVHAHLRVAARAVRHGLRHLRRVEVRRRARQRVRAPKHNLRVASRRLRGAGGKKGGALASADEGKRRSCCATQAARVAAEPLSEARRVSHRGSLESE